MMCKVLKLNRSTVHKVMHHKLGNQEIDRLDLESRLINIFNEFDHIYGAPKLTRELAKQGNITTIKHVSKYMKRLGLRSITVKKHKPGSSSKAPDGKPNLMDQDFATTRPNQKWVMDITYIWTVYDGWTYPRIRHRSSFKNDYRLL